MWWGFKFTQNKRILINKNVSEAPIMHLKLIVHICAVPDGLRSDQSKFPSACISAHKLHYT